MVVRQLEGCRRLKARKERRVVVRRLARGHRPEHVTRDQRVVDVAREPRHTGRAQQRQAEVEARRVDEHVGRHARDRLRREHERTESLAQQRRHRVALRLDPPAPRQPHKLDLFGHGYAKAAEGVRADLVVGDGITSVHDDAPARGVDHGPCQQLTYCHPEHALSTAAVVAVRVKKGDGPAATADRAQGQAHAQSQEQKSDERENGRHEQAEGEHVSQHGRQRRWRSGVIAALGLLSPWTRGE